MALRIERRSWYTAPTDASGRSLGPGWYGEPKPCDGRIVGPYDTREEAEQAAFRLLRIRCNQCPRPALPGETTCGDEVCEARDTGICLDCDRSTDGDINDFGRCEDCARAYQRDTDAERAADAERGH